MSGPGAVGPGRGRPDDQTRQARSARSAGGAADMNPRPRAGLLTRNLMDRSKLEAGLEQAGWNASHLTGPQLPPSLDGILVDLEHPAALPIIAAAASVRVPCLAYGPHVNTEALKAARQAGAAEALPRSRVFRDIPALASRLRPSQM